MTAVPRARNFSALALKTGVSREGLRKALSADGNPSFALVLQIALALDLDLALKPAHTSERPQASAD